MRTKLFVPWMLRSRRFALLVWAAIGILVPRPFDPTVIVSVTTYPARLEHIHRTLLTLLAQSRRTLICVVLSADQVPTPACLPAPLRFLVAIHPGRLMVVWDSGDKRSYKKLIPPARLFPTRNIVTVDDDVLYPRGLVDNLARAAERYPRSTIGTRGQWIEAGQELLAPGCWGDGVRERQSLRVFLNGRGGVFYPAGVLDAMFLDFEQANSIAPDQDDLWFKAASVCAKVPSVLIGPRKEFADATGGLEGLHVENVSGGRNEAAWHGICEAFPEAIRRISGACS